MTYLGQINFMKKFTWPKLLQVKSSNIPAQALGTAHSGVSWQIAVAGMWDMCEHEVPLPNRKPE